MIAAMTVVLALSCASQADPEEIAKILKQLSSVPNYSFMLEEVSSGRENGWRKVLEGKVETGRSAWFKSGELEAYRREQKLALLHGNDWQKVDSGSPEPRKPKGVPEQMTLRNLLSTKLPHEELLGLETQLQSMEKKAEKDGEWTVFVGTLSEDGVRSYLEPGEGKGSAAFTGTFRLWVGADGKVGMYETVVKATGKKRGGSGLVVHRNIRISEIGATSVSVPDEVEKAFLQEPKSGREEK